MIFYCVILQKKKKKQWVAKHVTEQWLKAAVLQAVKTGKKGCVTPFYRIARSKDRKRCWLTFLCHKTLPNVEYVYVCMYVCTYVRTYVCLWGMLRDRQVHDLS